MRRRGRDPRTPAPGVRRHSAGWQTRVKVRGEWSFAQWPLDTPLTQMIEWVKDERARLRITIPTTKGGTLAADVAKYLALESVQAMPTFGQRRQHLGEWTAIFGARRRRTIAALEIEEQRDAWLREMSASSVNKRLRALSNVWTKLDGRRAPNPVLEIAECEEPDPEARGLPYDVIEAILAEIPDTAIGVRKDGTRTAGVPRPSMTRARLRVIAYTGLAHAQLKRLTPADVDLISGTVRVVARRKGRKHQRAAQKPLPQLLPLLPAAVEAFREFDRLRCWGSFSNSSMWKAFTRACTRLGLRGLRPYDFRHSLLTAVYLETRDLRVTGALGSHRSEATTKRYTLAAVSPQVQAAIDALAVRFRPPLQAASGAQASGIRRNLAERSGGPPGGPD
jgi:integrase